MNYASLNYLLQCAKEAKKEMESTKSQLEHRMILDRKMRNLKLLGFNKSELQVEIRNLTRGI